MQEAEVSSRNPPGRSCVTCRKRKIKCDRDQPCKYCSKLGLECVYVDVKAKERETPTDDVGSRLERIEALLQGLDLKVSNTTAGDILPSNYNPPPGPEKLRDSTRSQYSNTARNGRLIPGDDDGRYITHGFWTGLDERDTNKENRSFRPAAPTPGSTPFATTSNVGDVSIPEADSRSRRLLQLHPTGDQFFALWQVYLENVDPIFKLTHVPTMQRNLFRASQHLPEVPPAFEALMFAVYFAAITSMPSSVSLRAFREDRPILLRRYRLGLEQALARANFMTRPNVTTVQALTLFLTCARMSAEKDYVWSMVGLLIRFAMKLGLHRDPADLGLSPFQSEMRRRLWWQIYVLDIRTAEDSDMNPFICEYAFNTRFPANVNDGDLDVNMMHDLSGAKGQTEMLFTLLRIEVSYAVRNIIFTPELAANNSHVIPSLTERRDAIDELLVKLQDKYFQYCDPQVPICFLAETATRMIITKVKLTMNHPARNGSAYCQSIMRDLALQGVEIVECAHTLRTSEKYSRWVWLFERYVDWDAVAFLLHIINVTPSCVPHERAWAAIDIFFSDWDGRATDAERWQRLGELRAKAVAKQSNFATSASTTNENLPNQRPPGPSTEAGFADKLSAAEAIQSNAVSAPVSNCPMEFTSGHTEIFESADIGAADMVVDRADWSFDNFSFTRGGPSWDMDFDDDAFLIHGLE